MDEVALQREKRRAEKHTEEQLDKLMAIFLGLPTDEFREEIIDIMSQGRDLAPEEFERKLRDFVERVNAAFPTAEIVPFPIRSATPKP